MDKLINEILDMLIKNNVVNPLSLRNFTIRQRYHELYHVRKMKSKDARKQLADEFNLGEKSIEHILYLQKKDNQQHNFSK